MAYITPVQLQIHLNNPSEGQAYVQVSYDIGPTGGDTTLQRTYREVMQLIRLGGIGEEQLVPGGEVSGTVKWTPQDPESPPRTRELKLPMANLEQGSLGPSEPNRIRARVKLVPLPPDTQVEESNTVDTHEEPIIET